MAVCWLLLTDHIMVHLKLRPEAGKQTELSDYGALVSDISLWFNTTLPGCRQVCITNYLQTNLIPKNVQQ